jgi:hypothetical protein
MMKEIAARKIVEQAGKRGLSAYPFELKDEKGVWVVHFDSPWEICSEPADAKKRLNWKPRRSS